jgi:hypothetical protein
MTGRLSVIGIKNLWKTGMLPPEVVICQRINVGA